MPRSYSTTSAEAEALSWFAFREISVRTVQADSFGPCEWCDDMDCVATVRVYGDPHSTALLPVTLVHVGGSDCAREVILQAISERTDDRDIVVEVAC